jgi:Flp pilus assembly protein TadG
MITSHVRDRRRGAILPLVVLIIIGLCGCVALAVDIGLVVVARVECQNAADLSAMAGARTLATSGSSGNVTAATATAISAATANSIWSRPIQASEVTVQAGAYHYDPNAQVFVPQFPPGSGDNYSLMQVTINHSGNVLFARVFGIQMFTVSATATAAHRPRDVAIVLDYSGSMNNESDLWNCETYLGAQINTSNNTDPVFPQFGPYDTTFSPLALLQCTSSDPRVGFCNVSQPVMGVPALVNDFYQNDRGAAAVAAFNPAPATVTSTNPGGDTYLPKLNTTTTALTWQDITGSGSTAFPGYQAYSGTPFNGWTQGPAYWGKTFFIWPPDPNDDWRKNFFLKSGGSYPNFGGPVNDDTLLWNSSGQWQNPEGNYVINYKAILAWISANCVQSSPTDPKPFPPQLRAGGVLYYGSIPTDVPAAAYDHTQVNGSITWASQDQRFWKEYIDYVLGVWRDPFGNIQNPPVPAASIGGDYTAGSSTAGQYVSISGPDQPDPSGKSFISPTDNPLRPRHRFWFGPMTLIQYLSDAGLFPGTTHDVSMIAAKLGIAGALQDIQNNHPNDLVSMLLFGRPHYSGEPIDVGDFTQPQFNLTNNYTALTNGLWFAPNAPSTDVRPWDLANAQTPRAHGDYTANTATSYGFMLAYNQFSSSPTAQTEGIGGFGRRGSQRLVILETDGMANVATTAGFTNAGATFSYYNTSPSDTISVNNSVTPEQDALNVVGRICALETDNSVGPGYATARKPVLVHCIAFGAIFEPTASGSEATTAMAFLQQVSAIGNTGFPPSVTATTDPNYYKLCIGTLQQRQDKLRQAFTTIMDETEAISLVK